MEPAKTSSLACSIPSPLFILQNAHPVNYVQFSDSNSNLIYSGNRNGDLSIYDLKFRRSLFSKNANNQPVLSIIELNESCLLSQNRSGSIFKWNLNDVSNWNFERVYENECYTFCQFALSEDKKLIYFPSRQPSAIEWIDINTFSKIAEFEPNKISNKKDRGMLMNLKVIDNFSLFAGYENGELVLFDTRILKEIDSINCFNGQPVMCFDYSKEIGVGAAGSSEHELKSFKLNLNSSTSKLEEKFATNLVNPGLNCLEIRKTDSKIFACGGWDSRVRVYGIKKLKLLAVLDFHKDPINSIKFSSFNQMAVGSADGMISFWNIY